MTGLVYGPHRGRFSVQYGGLGPRRSGESGQHVECDRPGGAGSGGQRLKLSPRQAVLAEGKKPGAARIRVHGNSPAFGRYAVGFPLRGWESWAKWLVEDRRI